MEATLLNGLIASRPSYFQIGEDSVMLVQPPPTPVVAWTPYGDEERHVPIRLNGPFPEGTTSGVRSGLNGSRVLLISSDGSTPNVLK